jgi:hypothetical protein
MVKREVAVVVQGAAVGVDVVDVRPRAYVEAITTRLQT